MKRILACIFSLLILLSSCTAAENSESVETVTDDITKEINEPEDSVKVDFQNNNSYTELGITDEMNEIIKEYFVRYYSALGDFSDLTFNDLYYFDTEYERGIANMMIAYQNKLRRSMSLDFTYNECVVGVTYKSIAETDKGTEIYLTQNDAINYGFIPDITSYTSDVEHSFVIKAVENDYYIVSHSEISGVYTLITEAYNKFLRESNLTFSVLTPERINSTMDELNTTVANRVTEELSNILSERDNYNKEPEKYISNVTANNNYDPQKALEYSYKWIGKTEHLRNPSFTEYDIYGGNCNNFTSQCLLAGGIPMDISGKQWKWYGEDINNTGGRFGRSSSWAACEYFYEYCRDNSGYGLVTDINSNLYSGRPGDIIQYVSDGVGVHSVIISKVIYDENGNVLEYLVNSNTTDKIDSPMILYGYTDLRLIKIIGYN